MSAAIRGEKLCPALNKPSYIPGTPSKETHPITRKVGTSGKPPENDWLLIVVRLLGIAIDVVDLFRADSQFERLR